MNIFDKCLTLEQYYEIMTKIRNEHSFGKHKHTKWIKYVRPQFDMRDGKCFHIKFEGAFEGNEKIFSQKDEGLMFDNIMIWLEE